MIFTDDILMQIAIVILGASGFLVAKHIYGSKKTGMPLVCPVRFDCHSVVNSDYSKIFGIPVELLGMGYYALIALAYLLSIFVILPATLHTIFFIFSKLAFLFSLYLIGVQIFVLKKGCSWCIVSAILSTLILLSSLSIYKPELLSKILIW